MSFLSSILPAVGAIAGSFFGPAGTAVGGALGSAIGGSMSSSDAADAQTQAGQNAINAQLEMYGRTRQDLMPWINSGGVANPLLMQLLGIGGTSQNPTFNPNAMLVRPFGMSDFQADPSYAFRQREMQNALVNKATALGGVDSGATRKALMERSGDLASQEYGNAYNRWNQNMKSIYDRISGISDTGANAAARMGGIGSNTANQVGDFWTQIGNAQSAGITQAQNSANNAISSSLPWLMRANTADPFAGYGGFGGAVQNVLTGGYTSPAYADTLGAGWVW